MTKRDIFEESIWFTATAATEAKPVMYRGRHMSPTASGRELLPNLLVVDLTYSPIDEIGLPTDEQYLRIGQFEDECLDPLERDRLGLLAFVRTCDGVVQYFVYVQSVDIVVSAIDNRNAGRHEVTFASDTDPNWTEYARFLAGMDSSSVDQ